MGTRAFLDETVTRKDQVKFNRPLNMDETMKSDLASQIEKVLLKTPNRETKEQLSSFNREKRDKIRPKSSYVRGSFEAI